MLCNFVTGRQITWQHITPVWQHQLEFIQNLARELILQLKTGRVSLDYFRDKFHVELDETYEPALEVLRGQGMLEIDESEIRISPEGVLRVDRPNRS